MTYDADANAVYDQVVPSARLLRTQLLLKEDVSNKVTSLSSSSTDTQYPSAKCVYDQLATKKRCNGRFTGHNSTYK